MVRGDDRRGAADLLPDAALRLRALLPQGGGAAWGGNRRPLSRGDPICGADRVGLWADGPISINHIMAAWNGL